MVRPLYGRGIVNKIFVVETTSSKLIIRMSDEAEASDQYRKEAWCIEKASGLGVPSPTVLALGESGETAYMLQSYVEGDNGDESLVPKSQIWRVLGLYAKVVHSIEVAGFGLKLSDFTQGDSQKSWLAYLNYNIESLTERDELIGLGVLTRAEQVRVRACLEELKDCSFRFAVNHGDLSLKNTVVNETGHVTLLDWGSAAADIAPHLDLIQLMKMNMIENRPNEQEMLAFLYGYEISEREFNMMKPVLESLLLLRAFDKLRWAIDCQPAKINSFVLHARAALRRKLYGT